MLHNHVSERCDLVACGVIVYIKNSPDPPESSIMRDSGIRKFCLEFMYEVCHKDSEESRA